MTFPWPEPARLQRCEHCHRPVPRGQLVQGYGSECAERLGLTVATPRLRTDPQTGPTLFDDQGDDDGEPDDSCE